MKDLAQKYILLTGATGGIGSAAALALAGEGASLYLSARDMGALERVKHQVSFVADREPGVFAADLTDPDAVARLMDEATRHFGEPPYAVVNAAGVGVVKPVENITPEEFRTSLDVNLYGAMLLSQAAVRAMAPRKSGHLLHVIGILGKAPMAQASAYCASKYGLSGFLAALRAEVARKHGIKITGLYLGGVDTPFWDNPSIEMRVQRDKMLSADDAASAILFALSQPDHLVLGELTLQPESHQL